MKITNRKIIIIFVIFFGLFNFLFASNQKGTLLLEIKGFGIRHGTPNNLNIGEIQYSTQEQQITGIFNDYFWIEDGLGLISGHYSTIQCDGLYGPNESIITGIYLKNGNSSPALIMGLTGNVLISSNLNDYQSIYDPVVYIYKPTSVSNAGLANKYGDIPIIKIIIPANMQPGTYRGTIVFSLYAN